MAWYFHFKVVNINYGYEKFCHEANVKQPWIGVRKNHGNCLITPINNEGFNDVDNGEGLKFNSMIQSSDKRVDNI